MRLVNPYIFIFLNFLFFTTEVCSGQHIYDIIQPVKITAGKSDTILVSDLFYAESYNLEFSSNKNIKIEYLKDKLTLILEPVSNFIDADFIEFKFKDASYQIPVIVKSESSDQQLHTFLYKSTEKAEKIFVTGSFNNWDKEKDRLTDVKGNGVYELTLPLDPGNYMYKFIIDGKPVVDPSNPEKAPSGFDDFNSVLRIKETDTTRTFLHINKYELGKNGKVSFSFVYENSTEPAKLTKNEIFALLNNNLINPEDITVDSRMVVVKQDLKSLHGEKVLRIFISRNGKTTNIQQVILNNGIPAGRTKSDWSWYDAAIYSLMIDRFCDGDKKNDKPVVHDSIFYQANYQGGDFKGICDKIKEGYFDSLGVNTLWISPVYDNPDEAYREYPPPYRWYSGYHGYWPISDTRVEEKFGAFNDVKRIVTLAHQHHIKVLLDFIAHHVHIQHPFYRDHPDWFGTLDLPDGRKNLRLWDEQRLTTWFEPYMPSFDFIKSAQALNVVTDNAVWWLKQTGADGYRHDAVKHVPNLFWRALTRKLKEQIEMPMHRKVYQIGETFGDYDLIGSYVNNGQLSAQFNFNLSYFAIPVFLEKDRSFSAVDFHLNKSFDTFGANNLMGNIMDSHDKVRFMAYADGKVKNQGVDTREMAWTNPPTVDHASSYKKAELYYAYMFTIPGLPVVYYGSEFGMTGADDPDNRRMMRFGDQLSYLEKKMLNETSKIIKMRNNHSALRYGDFYTLMADTSFYAYVRSDFNEKLLVVLNKSEDSKLLRLQLPSVYRADDLTDVQTGEKIKIQSNSAGIHIPLFGWRVFKIN